MQPSKLTLDELIDGEIETIMYTCAPQVVKDVSRKRLKELRSERDAVRLKAPPAISTADHYCVRCGGHGYLLFSAEQTDFQQCACVGRSAQGIEARKGRGEDSVHKSPSAEGGAP